MSETPGWTSPSPEGGPPAAPPGWGAPPPPGTPPPTAEGWSGVAAGAPSWGGQPSGYGTAQVTKPGIIPLRPLGLGEILDGAITTMRTYPKAALGFATVIASVTQLLSFFLLDTLARDASTLLTQEEVDALAAETTAIRIVLTIVTFIANSILTGCIAGIMKEAILGRAVTFSEAWAHVRPRFWVLVRTALLGGLIVFGGFLLLFLPALYFAVVFSLAGPVVILENASPTRALRRSWDLVKGSWWRVFGILLLTYVVAMFIGLAIQAPFGFVGDGGFLLTQDTRALTTGDIALLSFAGVLATAITGPFVSGVMCLLYVDRRMRREGLDVTLAATAAQHASGPQAGAIPGSQYPTA